MKFFSLNRVSINNAAALNLHSLLHKNNVSSIIGKNYYFITHIINTPKKFIIIEMHIIIQKISN